MFSSVAVWLFDQSSLKSSANSACVFPSRKANIKHGLYGRTEAALLRTVIDLLLKLQGFDNGATSEFGLLLVSKIVATFHLKSRLGRTRRREVSI